MLVDEQTLKHFAEGAESVVRVTAGVSTELVNEAINLFIIESALNILKFAAVFVVFFIVKKYLDTMMAASEDKNKGLFKSFKTTALVLTIIFFTTQSFPHITEMCKAIVAPKIFLLQKGSELLKK